MINKGLIVSIQKYTQPTTQELALKSIQGGAVAIRTDQEIKCEKPIIGLKKLGGKEFYITTTRDAILEVSKWSDYVAIDSRKGNTEIELLYAHCHVTNVKIVADIETVEDVQNVLSICNKSRIKKPEYFATTFAFNCKIIKEIKEISDIPVIAEGGYSSRLSMNIARHAGADNICIGTAISDIETQTKKYKDKWSMTCY
jgi:N-acylglucosamine-6-phosphate 2-epimerase